MGEAVYRRPFADRLAEARPILLDGATGTELERRGVACALPFWSAQALIDAPAVVAAVHRDFADAGAEVITANTFRTQTRTLAHGGLADRARDLTAQAVALARGAAGDRCWVAGSIAPLEDCWHPERTPDATALDRDHAEHATNLRDAGADLLLVETMITVREAVAATRAATATRLPVWVSFACDDRARLLSGEPLADAVAAVAAFAPALVGVNCLPPPHVDPALDVLAASGLRFAVYANLGAPTPDGARTHDASPSAYAAAARRWIDAGASAVGGCCGTTPAHVRALAALLEIGAR
jgi:S-methylmethionine-dependent homocysteine/selenocysteine methylase